MGSGIFRHGASARASPPSLPSRGETRRRENQSHRPAPARERMVTGIPVRACSAKGSDHVPERRGRR